MAHAHAGNTSLAVELIKREWGYMLNNVNSTQSSFWEGYQADGQFAYAGTCADTRPFVTHLLLGNYMSHAHGWATGPAPALHGYVLGVRVAEPADLAEARANTDVGPSYVVQPRPPLSLMFCEGALRLPSASSPLPSPESASAEVPFAGLRVVWENLLLLPDGGPAREEREGSRDSSHTRPAFTLWVDSVALSADSEGWLGVPVLHFSNETHGQATVTVACDPAKYFAADPGLASLSRPRPAQQTVTGHGLPRTPQPLAQMVRVFPDGEANFAKEGSLLAGVSLEYLPREGLRGQVQRAGRRCASILVVFLQYFLLYC
jgi:hypothetical protein